MTQVASCRRCGTTLGPASHEMAMCCPCGRRLVAGAAAESGTVPVVEWLPMPVTATVSAGAAMVTGVRMWGGML